MKFRTKIALFFFLTTFITGSVMTGITTITYHRSIIEELIGRGSSLLRTLEPVICERIFLGELFSLQKMLASIRIKERDVKYLFITGKDGKILAHSFEKGFPSALLRFASHDPGIEGEEEGREIFTEEGRIWQIKRPLPMEMGFVFIGMNEERPRKIMVRNLEMVSVFLFCLVFFCSILVGFYAGHSLKPLVEISRGASAVGNGRFDYRIHLARKDELGDLSRSFNRMAANLEQYNEDLKSAQENLIQTQKLAAVGQFVTGVAHEINNPLSGILNCLDWFSKSGTLNERERKYLDLIEKGSSRIERVVKQLLAFSDRRNMVLEKINLNQLIKDVVDYSMLELEKRLISLEMDLCHEDLKVRADQGGLQQVFLNVLKNSMDAMEKGGKITIRTRRNEKNVQVDIEDTGCGIDEDYLPRVFEPFFTTKEIGKGTGLGLYITYNIIKEHKGIIKLTRRKEGGTITRIILPAVS